MRELKELADSNLMRRLTKSPEDEVQALSNTVRSVAKQAAHFRDRCYR